MVETLMRPAEGQVLLYDPEHVSLTFGAAEEIKFGPKGNAEPGFALVSEDEPLLDALLRAYPAIQVVTVKSQTFVCVQCTPNTEWASRAAFNGHTRAKHHKAAPAAE
jgi:hypothetical protein